jgi:hypothetical protein
MGFAKAPALFANFLCRLAPFHIEILCAARHVLQGSLHNHCRGLSMISYGETRLPPRTKARWWRTFGYVALPVAGVMLGAILAVWAGNGASAPSIIDERVQYCMPEGGAPPPCHDHAAAPPHPARGANIPLRVHSAPDPRP